MLVKLSRSYCLCEKASPMNLQVPRSNQAECLPSFRTIESEGAATIGMLLPSK